MNRRALLISVASLGLFGSSAVLARSATVDFTFGVRYYIIKFSITINPMTTLISGPNKVHPKYNQWVRNLNKHILAQLSTLSLGVKP